MLAAKLFSSDFEECSCPKSLVQVLASAERIPSRGLSLQEGLEGDGCADEGKIVAKEECSHGRNDSQDIDAVVEDLFGRRDGEIRPLERCSSHAGGSLHKS